MPSLRDPEQELQLGGGSALATWWGHQFNADIDLACNREVFERALDRQGRLRLLDTLRAQTSQGEGISVIRVSPGIVGWNTATGLVCIVSSLLPDSPDLCSDYTIEGTGVRLASVDAILKGKLMDRLRANNTPTDRLG